MPLQIDLPFTIDKQITNLELKPTFFIDPGVWLGLPVSRLPYFEKLASFFQSVGIEGNLRIVYTIEGNFIFSDSVRPRWPFGALARTVTC